MIDRAPALLSTGFSQSFRFGFSSTLDSKDLSRIQDRFLPFVLVISNPPL